MLLIVNVWKSCREKTGATSGGILWTCLHTEMFWWINMKWTGWFMYSLRCFCGANVNPSAQPHFSQYETSFIFHDRSLFSPTPNSFSTITLHLSIAVDCIENRTALLPVDFYGQKRIVWPNCGAQILWKHQQPTTVGIMAVFSPPAVVVWSFCKASEALIPPEIWVFTVCIESTYWVRDILNAAGLHHRNWEKK